MTLSVPLCHLAEVLGVRLKTTPEGQAVITSLTTTPHKGETRFLYGPDLQAITAEICSVERLHAQCEPAFIELLTRLGLEATLPTVDAA